MRADGYHSSRDLDAAVDRAITSASDRTSSSLLGTSVQGRPIRSVTVAAPGRAPDRSRPQAMVIANIHGVEVISSELALAVLGELCSDTAAAHVASLLDVCDVTVVPVVNPDGREASLAGLAGRRIFNPAPRRNVRGVDLNRNWPFPEGVSDHWLPVSGTSLGFLPWYRGRSPLSEPETAALADLARRLRPFGLLNLHSTGQILTYPWTSRVDPPRDEAGFKAMAAAFRSRQAHWSYRVKQGRNWYPIVGSSNDWFYDSFGTMAMTVEIAPTLAAAARNPRLARWWFWACNPSDPEAHVRNDITSCFAALTAAHDWRARHPAREYPEP